MQIKPEKKVCLLVVIQTQGLLPSESMFFVSLYSGQGLFTRETNLPLLLGLNHCAFFVSLLQHLEVVLQLLLV